MADNNGAPPEISWAQYRATIPVGLLAYIQYWNSWCKLIIHNGANVQPYVMAPYTQAAVSREVRPAPFPLNIEETWYCGLLILLIVACHIVTNDDELSAIVYPQALWAARVAGRVSLTLGAAVLSTCSFEIAGSLLMQRFNAARALVCERLSRFIDPNTEMLALLQYLLSEMAIMLFDFLTFSFHGKVRALMEPCVEKVISPALYFFFAIPVNFVPTALSWIYLPAPGPDEVQDLRTLWFEYGVPITIQLWLTSFLWLLLILFMVKAERLALKGWRITDPKLTLVWQLIRATSMHLMAYTAYQLVCATLAGIRLGFPSHYPSLLERYSSPFLNKLMPNGNITAAVLLLLAHALLAAASFLAARFSRPFWIPYILWQTEFARHAAEMSWYAHLKFIWANFHMPKTRLRIISRVLMTSIFGLESSWPAGMNLSAVVPDG